jgi:hypothetical protein
MSLLLVTTYKSTRYLYSFSIVTIVYLYKYSSYIVTYISTRHILAKLIEPKSKKTKNERYPDFACSHEPYYYLDLHELNFPDRDERGCGLVNMTVHVGGGNYRH